MNYLYNKIGLVALLSVITLQGCAQSQSFSPPANGEQLHFTATISSELVSSPIYAVYRSEICRKENRNSNMEVYTVPGYHREQYSLTVKASNQVGANIPMSGGGKCDWKLSNIKFEVKLKDPLKIDPLISKNFGVEATFVLDNNAPATFDGGYEQKSGDVNETLTLFPLVSQRYPSENTKQIWLISKYKTMTYKVNNSKKIDINVDYKSDLKSYWYGIKNEGDSMATLVYPNGKQEKTREIFPDYEKLSEISESMSPK
ncbi:hypothetical protein AB7W88_20535 [Providencia vermicola]|uniref:hypothetical protein n=1 Tax=Providencia TaxID=586 RepID=UPI0032D9C557